MNPVLQSFQLCINKNPLIKIKKGVMYGGIGMACMPGIKKPDSRH